jgi:ATP-dependent Lon protease
MPKRPSRENPRERKGSADLTDEERQKKRRNRKSSEDVTWVKDTTLIIEDTDSDDSTYVPEEDDDEDDEITYNQFIEALLKSCPSDEKEEKPKRSKNKKNIEPAIKLSKPETEYFNKLTHAKQVELNESMKKIRDYGQSDKDVPLKFRIIALPISDYMKTSVLRKLKAIDDDSGEGHKLRNWIESFLKIPFGVQIPLPVKLMDGKVKCSQFMRESRSIMDKAVYGMVPAKTQIMQVIAQWMANPEAVGNVIALQGPAGVGKTSIARNGIAQALHRPFQSFALGGASDISNFVGHSYTYEGSMCGRIAESLMQSKCMNPVLYFDELDKISNTPHGEEISSMLIHLTDRSQNSQFHDRYFAGVDFDMSQCLFVLSFNDISAVNPILRDRMQVIHCPGYSEKDKKVILEDYIWPDLLNRLRFEKSDVVLTPEASKFLITEYSSKEEGVRTLIRTAESIITRLNMLRIADDELMKDYKFYVKVDFPLTLTESTIKTLLIDAVPKESEAWRNMYN